MNLTDFQVPQSVRSAADRALTLHRRNPIAGVGGVAIAERLVSGTVALEDVRSMRRFFQVNQRERDRLTSLQHTAETQALMRSWQLYGDVSGKTWSEGVDRALVAAGQVAKDPWLTLLRAEPSDVEHRLSHGAWTWEYDMDARKAARFVEEYQRSQGKTFDLPRAFGDSTGTVIRAINRRVSRENPFRQLAQAVMRRDYTAAARRDLMECRQATAAGGMRWPSLIAWSIVGTHAPDLLRAFEENYRFAPTRGREVRALLEYSEPVADYVAFLHPDGSRFSRDTPGPVLGAADGLIWNVIEGEGHEDAVREMLETIRLWSGRAKHAEGLGHTLLEAWKLREWSVIADALPHEGAIRTLFETFRIRCQAGPLEERVVDRPPVSS